MSSTGRRTISAGIPGTGLYAYESVNPRAAARKSAAQQLAVQRNTSPDLHSFPQPTPKPSLFSNKAEKAFATFLTDIYDADHQYTPHEKFDDALSVLYEMKANQLTAISMADIELRMKDYDAVLETTSDITNEDDATVILLVLRGIAFREQGLFDASLECLKQALAKKTRGPDALHRAHFERSITYEKMKKFALARKELELILVDDPSNQEVKDRLKTLPGARD
jgi:tetratricopeptide (TPR) repeat protein